MPVRPERLPLRGLNPLSKLAVALAYIVAATLVFDAGFQLLLLIAVMVALIALEGVDPITLLRVMAPFALVGFGYLWANLLFPGSTASYSGSLEAAALVRDPAVDAGLTLFLRALCFGAISYAFIRTTDPSDFVQALMQRTRLPAHIGFSIFCALQFLPALRDEARQIRMARRMRRQRRVRGWTPLQETAGLAIPLLASTMRKASRAAISMEARGLQRTMVRTSLRASTFVPADGVFLLCSGALVVLIWFLARGLD